MACAKAGKNLLFIWLYIFSIKTDTKRIMHVDELSSVLRLNIRAQPMSDSLSRRLLLVFIEAHNAKTVRRIILPALLWNDIVE